MSDTTPTGQPQAQPPAAPVTTGQPNTPAQESGQPTAGTQTPAAQPAEPFRAFATQADLDRFVSGSKKQAERKALREAAQALGFDEWADAVDAFQALRPTAPTPGQGAGNPPAPNQPTQQGPSEADRLRLALKVGAAKGLHPTLIERLRGDTEEAMAADADALLGLAAQPTANRPGIPPPPQGGQPVTFTTAQMSDPKFVREHAAEIRRAAAEGRIVRS